MLFYSFIYTSNKTETGNRVNAVSVQSHMTPEEATGHAQTMLEKPGIYGAASMQDDTRGSQRIIYAQIKEEALTVRKMMERGGYPNAQ